VFLNDLLEGMSGLLEAGLLEGDRAGLLEGDRAGLLEGDRAGLLEGDRAGLLEASFIGGETGLETCIEVRAGEADIDFDIGD